MKSQILEAALDIAENGLWTGEYKIVWNGAAADKFPIKPGESILQQVAEVLAKEVRRLESCQ